MGDLEKCWAVWKRRMAWCIASPLPRVACACLLLILEIVEKCASWFVLVAATTAKLCISGCSLQVVQVPSPKASRSGHHKTPLVRTSVIYRALIQAASLPRS